MTEKVILGCEVSMAEKVIVGDTSTSNWDTVSCDLNLFNALFNHYKEAVGPCTVPGRLCNLWADWPEHPTPHLLGPAIITYSFSLQHNSPIHRYLQFGGFGDFGGLRMSVSVGGRAKPGPSTSAHRPCRRLLRLYV